VHWWRRAHAGDPWRLDWGFVEWSILPRRACSMLKKKVDLRKFGLFREISVAGKHRCLASIGGEQRCVRIVLEDERRF
jgi:hypothetical protein